MAAILMRWMLAACGEIPACGRRLGSQCIGEAGSFGGRLVKPARETCPPAGACEVEVIPSRAHSQLLVALMCCLWYTCAGVET